MRITLSPLANSSYLLIFTGVDYLLPVILIPFLVNALGLAEYGTIVFSQACIGLLLMLVDYGFMVTAVKQVAEGLDSSALRARYSVILVTRIFLCFIGYLLLAAFLLSFATRDINVNIIVFMAIGNMGYVFYSQWLYIGLQRASFVTVANVFSKSMLVLGTLVLVKQPGDGTVYALIYAASQWILGLSCAAINTKLLDGQMCFKSVSVSSVAEELTTSSRFFLTNLSRSGYRMLPIIMLGFGMPNSALLGAYALAEKIVRAVCNLILPFDQGFFPHSVRVSKNPDQEFSSYAQKLIIAFVALGAALSLLLYFLSDFIVRFFLGHPDASTVFLLQILTPLPLVISMGSVAGNQIMLNIGLTTKFVVIVAIAGTVGAIFSTFAGFAALPTVTAYVVVACECGVSFSMVWLALRYLRLPDAGSKRVAE